MFKAVLFDLDNTLIDFLTMKRSAIDAAISAMIDSGLNIKKEKAKRLLFALYDKYGIEYHSIFQRFLLKTQHRIDYRILSNAITAYRRTQMGFTVPYPHVRSTLVKLKEKGLKLGIVSDAPRLKAWLRLSEMNISEFFDVVVTLDDTGYLKPNELPFRKALKRLRVKPSEVLFVGDNPGRDIKGAKSVGMRTCLAKYGQVFPSKGIKPDYTIKDIKRLLEIV